MYFLYCLKWLNKMSSLNNNNNKSSIKKLSGQIHYSYVNLEEKVLNCYEYDTMLKLYISQIIIIQFYHFYYFFFFFIALIYSMQKCLSSEFSTNKGIKSDVQTEISSYLLIILHIIGFRQFMYKEFQSLVLKMFLSKRKTYFITVLGHHLMSSIKIWVLQQNQFWTTDLGSQEPVLSALKCPRPMCLRLNAVTTKALPTWAIRLVLWAYCAWCS